MIQVSQPNLSRIESMLVQDCLDRGQVTQGPMVERFEREFAEFLGVRNAVMVSSGTTALHLALATLGIGPGDEVIVPNLTFVATANAVAYTGATPVLVDVDPKTWCIDPAAAAKAVTGRTRAIVPVHLYGVPCDMVTICRLAYEHGLRVVEDAAEGLGGFVYGGSLGTYGDAGIFSFYGNKILTTGEGGAVVTNNDRLAQRLRFLRGQAHDPRRRYYHREVGFNYRMTDLQAAVGVGQLARLPELLRQREEIFTYYRSQLQDIFTLPSVSEWHHQAPWLFTGLVHARERLAARLCAHGIETRPTFVPLNYQPAFRRSSKDLYSSVEIGQAGLSLPTYPGLTLEQLRTICNVVQQRA